MTIFRVIHDKNNPFTLINTTIASDKNLSWKAKGIWLYAFSRPDDWKFYMNDLIQKSTDGERSLIAGLKELEEYGYLYRFKKQNEKGQFEGWEWSFFETTKSKEEIQKMFPKHTFCHDRKMPTSAEPLPILNKDCLPNINVCSVPEGEKKISFLNGEGKCQEISEIELREKLKEFPDNVISEVIETLESYGGKISNVIKYAAGIAENLNKKYKKPKVNNGKSNTKSHSNQGATNGGGDKKRTGTFVRFACLD